MTTGLPTRSPLRGRYLVRNPGWAAWLRVKDLMLSLVPREAPPPHAAPRAVVLAVGGHLGDAVIATSLLRPAANAFPGARIGVLTGSWNAKVFDGHPLVSAVHAVDHWKLSRAAASLPARWRASVSSGQRAHGELRAAEYDLALDLSPYYPNAAHVLSRARIPVRVGFTSGGAGPLYTNAVDWRPGRHVAEDFAALLTAATGAERRASPAAPPAYDLAPIPGRAAETAAEKARGWRLSPKNFIVLHAGAGAERKQWLAEHWIVVGRALAGQGMRVVLTGAGGAQRDLAATIASAVPDAVNACDALDWDEFRWMLGHARAVVSVDTVAMHLAAAEGTPVIALMTGMDNPSRWRPLGGDNRVTVLSEPVACSPCYRSRGCAAMSCVRDVTPDDVLRAAQRYLSV